MVFLYNVASNWSLEVLSYFGVVGIATIAREIAPIKPQPPTTFFCREWKVDLPPPPLL